MAFAPRLLSQSLRSQVVRTAATLALAAGPAALAQAPTPPAPLSPARGAAAVAADDPDLFAAGGGVVRAGYEAPAGAASGVVRTAAEAPAPKKPAAKPAAGLPEAPHALGAPAANLDFFLAPRPAPAAAPAPRPTPAVEPGPQPAKAAEVAAEEPAAGEPAADEPAAPPAFTAADFGFGPAEPVAPATKPAPKKDAEVKTADAALNPAADPFAVVPAAAAPAPEPAAASEEPAGPAADPFAVAANPLSDNPLAADAPADPPAAAAPKKVADAGRDGARPSVRREVPDAAIEDPVGEAIDAADATAASDATAAGDATAADFAAAQSLSAAADGPQTAALGVRVRRRGPVRVGRPCEAELVVRNDGPADAAEVVVTAALPAGLTLTTAAPTPDAGAESRPAWVIPTLAAGEERVIALTLRPEVGGPARLAAGVRGTVAAADPLVVTEPKLAVKLDGAESALLGEPATQTILVSNPGTGAVDEVVIEAVLPDGLEHRGGPKRLTMNVLALAAGETKSVRLALVATAGGKQTVRVSVRGDAGLTAETERTVAVANPEIDLAIAGPSLRYVNRVAEIALTVTNPGDAATDNVRLAYRVPDGFEFLAADASGTHDPGGRLVTWFLGRVEAGQSRTATVKLKAVGAGEQTHVAQISGSGGAKASVKHLTRVEGTASLVLTIDDSDDPVEVGAETVYTVTVKNEGTAAAKTVGLACRLPTGCEAGPVRGPAASRREGRLVLFDSLPELEPGKRAVYTLRVKGTTPGGKRFQTRLVSDSISEPLIHEEITKFYAE